MPLSVCVRECVLLWMPYKTPDKFEYVVVCTKYAISLYVCEWHMNESNDIVPRASVTYLEHYNFFACAIWWISSCRSIDFAFIRNGAVYISFFICCWRLGQSKKHSSFTIQTKDFPMAASNSYLLIRFECDVNRPKKAQVNHSIHACVLPNTQQPTTIKLRRKNKTHIRSFIYHSSSLTQFIFSYTIFCAVFVVLFYI